MRHVVKVPPLSGMSGEAVLLEWRAAVGERVDVDQVIAVVETDKVAIDIPSPVSGVVAELIAEVDEPVAPGDRLCVVTS